MKRCSRLHSVFVACALLAASSTLTLAQTSQKRADLKAKARAAAGMGDVPLRRSGLWETTDLDDPSAKSEPPTRQCVDRDKERLFFASVMEEMAEPFLGSSCTFSGWKKAGSAVVSEMSCGARGKPNELKASIKVTGNPDIEVVVETLTKVDGRAVILRNKSTFKGRCPANMRPGDLIDGNGKVNVYE
jgi:hypothetical protein